MQSIKSKQKRLLFLVTIGAKLFMDKKSELEALGYKVSKPRVAHIMRVNYLFAKQKAKV